MHYMGSDPLFKVAIIRERTYLGIPDNTLTWAVQKWLNRSICHLGCGSGGLKEGLIVFARLGQCALTGGHIGPYRCGDKRRLLYFGDVIFCRQHCAQCNRRYISFSEANFEVFRRAGATRCIDGGEIWHEGVGIGPKNWNFYWHFTKIQNINRDVSLAQFSQNFQSLYIVSGWIC